MPSPRRRVSQSPLSPGFDRIAQEEPGRQVEDAEESADGEVENGMLPGVSHTDVGDNAGMSFIVVLGDTSTYCTDAPP